MPNAGYQMETDELRQARKTKLHVGARSSLFRPLAKMTKLTTVILRPRLQMRNARNYDREQARGWSLGRRVAQQIQ